MGPLTCENSEKITVKRKWIASLTLCVFLVGIRDERVDGAIKLVISTVPVQAIVPAFIADQFLRKLLGKLTRRAGEILPLRFDQLAARFHGGNFISPYAPEQDLVFSCGCVEKPRTVIVY